jgi:hypothetical protein
VLACLAGPASIAAGAPLRVTGVVIDAVSDHPLADCSITVKLDGISEPRVTAQTDPNGAFALDLVGLFGANVTSGNSLILEFAKPDFAPARKVVSITEVTAADAEPLRVRLSATSGPTDLDPQFKHQLDSHRDKNGRTLFLFEYIVPPGTGTPRRDTLTWLLSWQLSNLINSHLQEIARGSRTDPISVDTLICPMNIANSVRVDACGGYLGALAMIGGVASPVTSAGHPPSVLLESTFQPINHLSHEVGPPLSMRDHVSANLFDQAVNRQLNVEWKALAVLALVQRELEDNRPGATAKRCQARQLITEQLSSMAPSHNAVSNYVIEALQRLRDGIQDTCP